MDFTNSFPGSWNLVRKNLPGLIGAGVGAAAASIAAGRRAYKQVQRDNQTKFPTWSTKPSKMPYKTMSRRVKRRSSYRRRPYNRRRGMTTVSQKRLVRTSAVKSFSVVAGQTAFGGFSAVLNDVLLSDIQTMWRLYRIRKVVMTLTPRVDPGNSGLTNNFQFYVAACCDPENTTAPLNIQSVTAYDNSYSKFITSGDRFTYTFYPKVTNTVDSAGTALAAGSYAVNPWLRLDVPGSAVPHLHLKYGVATEATSTATSIAFNYVLEYHFDVRGIA